MTVEQEKLFQQLRDDVRDIKNALVGNDGMKTIGVIQKLDSVARQIEAHEAADEKKFAAIFQFQENGKLLIGWSRWTLGILGTGLIVFGGLIGWTITTLIALMK